MSDHAAQLLLSILTLGLSAIVGLLMSIAISLIRIADKLTEKKP